MANMAQAIRLALHYGEENLGVKEIFGEDVGAPLGGVFTATQGLKNAWNSPLDERGIVGAAMGLAWAGSRPVAEIQFVDYIFNVIDLLKLCGNAHWTSAGRYKTARMIGGKLSHWRPITGFPPPRSCRPLPITMLTAAQFFRLI